MLLLKVRPLKAQPKARQHRVSRWLKSDLVAHAEAAAALKMLPSG